MIERCRRLCGGLDACFINSNKYIECISDILINKAFGTTEILEQLIRECNDKKLSAFLREALRGPYELINWIKYLQVLEMADELSFNFFKNVIDLIQTI